MPVLKQNQEIIGWRKLGDDNVFICKSCFVGYPVDEATEKNREKLQMGQWEAYTKDGLREGLKCVCDWCGEEIEGN